MLPRRSHLADRYFVFVASGVSQDLRCSIVHPLLCMSMPSLISPGSLGPSLEGCWLVGHSSLLHGPSSRQPIGVLVTFPCEQQKKVRGLIQSPSKPKRGIWMIWEILRQRHFPAGPHWVRRDARSDSRGRRARLAVVAGRSPASGKAMEGLTVLPPWCAPSFAYC